MGPVPWARALSRWNEEPRPLEAPMSTEHPTCPDCHALVADLTAHERWHTRLVADVAKAVSQALERR
ncbi:hypothetical protein Pve01_91670 [Planomonospora venezuelensis]|nr:hypothetical protein Pve01_91670 [Planomonospora venezuelensis]